jgi:invasion protein IalB
MLHFFSLFKLFIFIGFALQAQEIFAKSRHDNPINNHNFQEDRLQADRGSVSIFPSFLGSGNSRNSFHVPSFVLAQLALPVEGAKPQEKALPQEEVSKEPTVKSEGLSLQGEPLEHLPFSHLTKSDDWQLVCQEERKKTERKKEAALNAQADKVQTDKNQADKNQEVKAIGEKVTSDETGKNCRLLQSHALDPKGKTIFLLSIVFDKAKGGAFAIITVPLEIYLAPGIAIQGEAKQPYKVLYEMCNVAGCHAGFKLSDDLMRQFSGVKTLKTTIWTTTNRAITIPLSPKGFKEGFAKMKASHL